MDTESRLWSLSSLRPDVVANNGFYVPNLLPKSTPPKKKTIRSTSATKNEDEIDKSAAAAVHEYSEVVEEGIVTAILGNSVVKTSFVEVSNEYKFVL